MAGGIPTARIAQSARSGSSPVRAERARTCFALRPGALANIARALIDSMPVSIEDRALRGSGVKLT